MALCQCEYCGRAFNSMSGQKICPNCAKEIDDVFARVKKYMYTKPGPLSAAMIVEDLEVPEKAISYLIKEQRLVLDGRHGETRSCKVCGAPTDGQSLCVKCRKTFDENMQSFMDDRQAKKTEAARKNGVLPIMRNKKS